MTPLQKWMRHRAQTIKLSWPRGVAEAAGVAPATLDSIAIAGDLDHVGRSARGYLARALKVSVRELEALSDRRIDWIADERVIDLDRLSSMAAQAPRPVAPAAVKCAPGRGAPILGCILQSGIVQQAEDWTAQDRARLPVRYTGFPDAFALELKFGAGAFEGEDCLVFQNIAPGEIVDGEMVLVTHEESGGESELCRVHRINEKLSCAPVGQCGTERFRQIELGQILRASRVIASCKRICGDPSSQSRR